eukprot:g12559.t1
MLAYLTLARVSDEKQQANGRDRFRILAGVAACRAGCLDVAERCRELVIEGNPKHLLARFPTMPEALREPEFAPFLRQLERFCGYEQAEHFLRENPVRITALKPSCGCLAPRLAKREFQPGEVGEIILPVKTPNEASGPREYTVKVQYEDPKPRETLLTFRVDLPEKRITVRPRSLIFYQYGTRSTTRDIFVTDYPRIGLQITKVECNSQYVDVKIAPADVDEYEIFLPMKPLRRFLDRIHPKFDKGGKLERLYPLYEGLDTFLYTPGDVTKGASHVRDGIDLKRMMGTVVVALIPCIFMAMWNTGYQANLALESMKVDPADVDGWRAGLLRGVGLGFSSDSLIDCLIHGALYFVPVFLVTNIVGGIWELIFCCVRKHDLNEGFLVTGMLFPLTLPPTIPLWQVALGISFGVVIGKEVFGGTGKNFLNPALTARAFLYFAYPADMTGDAIWTAVDGYTAATPLGAVAVADANQAMAAIDVSWSQAFLGVMPGSMGETSTLACLIGAAILIVTGIGSVRIMSGVLIGAFAFWMLLFVIGSDNNPMFKMSAEWHFVLGGFAFGLVFMATDPVSAAMTQTGQWFYGGLIGAMTILIRVINPAFPEGIMLAILFGNVFAPVIDAAVLNANIRRRKRRLRDEEN